MWLSKSVFLSLFHSRYRRCQWNRPCQAWRGRLCRNQGAVSPLPIVHWAIMERQKEGVGLNCYLFHCRMYQDKLASLKRQLQQLQEGNPLDFLMISRAATGILGGGIQIILFLSLMLFILARCLVKSWWLCVFSLCKCDFLFAGTLQEYQKRMKKLDQQYKERLRNAGELNDSWREAAVSFHLCEASSWLLSTVVGGKNNNFRPLWQVCNYKLLKIITCFKNNNVYNIFNFPLQIFFFSLRWVNPAKWSVIYSICVLQHKYHFSIRHISLSSVSE